MASIWSLLFCPDTDRIRIPSQTPFPRVNYVILFLRKMSWVRSPLLRDSKPVSAPPPTPAMGLEKTTSHAPVTNLLAYRLRDHEEDWPLAESESS